MNTIIHHAQDRGKGDYGWLTTRYSFSFSNWYNPERLGFGALLVINDDRIEAGQGFGTHRHDNMEIITIVTGGTLTHKDSLGNVGTIKAGEVQVMSAGTGVAHSEYNASDSEALTLFQIWILPNTQNVEPRYEQKQFPLGASGLTLLVAPIESGESLGIHQNAYITRAVLTAGDTLAYDVQAARNGVYAFVMAGSPVVAGTQLAERDALGITETQSIEIAATAPAEILLIEVPMPGR